MSSPAVGIESDRSMREADTLMMHFGLKAVPVFKPGTRRCIGILDAQTASRATSHKLGDRPVDDYMRRNIKSLAPDAPLRDISSIIVGGRQRLVPIVDKDLVVLGQDVLSSAVNTGQRVVVAGGGLVGVEVANYLASLLKDVTIVEMREGIALDETPAPRKDLLRDIHNNGVRVLTETSVKEIKEGSVVVTGETEEEIPADTVVLAIGRVSNTVLADQLKEAGYDVRIIGDAHTPALAGAANREGHLTALSL